MDKQALYPNTVSPLAMKVGVIVKHLPYGQNTPSEQTGVVTHIVPATGKVYVSWPTYGNTQHDPEELLIVTDGHGVQSGLTVYRGHMNFEKVLSERLYGKVTPKGVEKVASIALQDEITQKAASAYYSAATLKVIGYDKEAARKILAAQMGENEVISMGLEEAYNAED